MQTTSENMERVSNNEKTEKQENERKGTASQKNTKQ